MSCFFLPLTFLMGQCTVFCLLQHVMPIFTPCPFAGTVFHYKKDGGMWWGKDKGNAYQAFSPGTQTDSMTVVKKNSLFKTYPCLGAEAAPLALSLGFATRP